MNELERLEAEVLQRARRGYAAPRSAQAKVQAATLAAIATGAVVSMSAPALTARDVASAWRDALTLPRILVAAVALGGAGAGGYALGLREGLERAAAPTAAPAPLNAPMPTPIIEPAARSSVEVAPQPALPEKKRVQPTASVDVAPPTPSAGAASSELELSTLRRVERVLREGNPRFALALLADLDRSTPRGSLMEERQAARTVASCQLAAPEATRSLAASFSARYPSSVYASRVRDACTANTTGEQITLPGETNASKGRPSP